MSATAHIVPTYDDYTVVSAPDIGTLKKLVAEKFAEGYIPLGGLALDTGYAHQALARPAVLKSLLDGNTLRIETRVTGLVPVETKET